MTEEQLAAQLVGQGYVERTPENYDRVSALDRALVVHLIFAGSTLPFSRI